VSKKIWYEVQKKLSGVKNASWHAASINHRTLRSARGSMRNLRRIDADEVASYNYLPQTFRIVKVTMTMVTEETEVMR